MDISENTATSPTATIPELSPVIIPPTDHPITLEMIDKEALHVLRRLNAAGFSAYLVGGGVRDLYLGKKPKDFDISTDARPGQIRRLFPNSTTIGKRFRLVQVFFPEGKIIEVSTLRSLSEHDLEGPEAVLAPNNTFGSLDEDAQRRDLTINSLFFEIEQQTILDYVQGVRDLDDSIIRIIGDPEKRITRDPVRMMRAIRHSARLNFSIEAKTWDAICSNAQKLALCPTSRLRDELFKDLYGGAAAGWLQLAIDSGIFFGFFPFYRNILFQSSPKGSSPREQLAKIFCMIDRLTTFCDDRGNHPNLPQAFVLALILIPWANVRYDLSQQCLKGHAAFHFSKKIRDDIDNLLGHQLNLRRSLRQEIALLLTNVPLFIHHSQNGSWPKWLRKKSYFKSSSFFYHCFIEATTQQPIPLSDESLPPFYSPPRQKAPEDLHENPVRRKIKPAFSEKRKGGIFGFKK